MDVRMLLFQKQPPYFEAILSFSSELLSLHHGMVESPPANGHPAVQRDRSSPVVTEILVHWSNCHSTLTWLISPYPSSSTVGTGNSSYSPDSPVSPSGGSSEYSSMAGSGGSPAMETKDWYVKGGRPPFCKLAKPESVKHIWLWVMSHEFTGTEY